MSAPSTTTCGAGCLLAGFGAATAGLAWAPRASVSVDGGFEGHARDLSVLVVDLPLVLLGGALVPCLVWALTARRMRPWVAVLAALAALALGVWGLLEWWTPRRPPDPGYGDGI
jgi:L-cysteine desulfidase